MPMKVLSIKYQFCASVDPVTYDSFDIKAARSLEAMVQTHLASGSPYLDLYDMHLSGSMFDARNTYWGMTLTSSGWQSTSNWRRCETFIRRDDVLPTTPTSEGTFYVAYDDGSDNKSDADPPREVGLDGAEVALFSEPEPIPTIPEDVEGGSDDEEKDPRFRAYSPPAHMHNVDLSQDDALEFPDLPYRRRDRTSSSLDSGELEVGVSEDHPKMNSDMLATLILPTVKADPRTSVPVLITNIRSQLRTCDCGKFDALRYPCAHVIATCQNLRLDPMSYVDEVYKLETMYNVWRHVFPPVPNEPNWPPVSLTLFKLLPDRELRRKPKGRPCSTRIRDLGVGAGRVTHLYRIMIATVFASPMAEVFESRKVMGIGRKKSSPMAPRAIPHTTAAYRLEVDSE
ncbi:hypothetical protein GOBAR_AA03616 [Gossypium barbadense]|uniref:SWIM-type domain-containing protein n=1 Tax=Gossypium barbadense TaxID=3634 RepID=A0A2P5YN02_GOSBA|nr:hypothetical protein GOBAR_AA03616 [Gossypium barbadense]